MKKIVAIGLAVLAVVLVATGVMLSGMQSSSNDPSVETTIPPETSSAFVRQIGDHIVDITALADQTQRSSVAQQRLTLSSINAQAWIEFVFSGLEEVYYDTYEYHDGTAMVRETYWDSPEDENRVILYTEYRELFFQRQDPALPHTLTLTQEQVDTDLRELFSVYGISLAAFESAGDMGGPLIYESANEFLYLPKRIDGIPVSPYCPLGLYGCIGDEGIVWLSYMGYESAEPIGAPQELLSAYEAAQALFSQEEELETFGDVVVTQAELVYDMIYVEDHADKAILRPVWHLLTADEMLFMVDACTGTWLWDQEETTVTLACWQGE